MIDIRSVNTGVRELRRNIRLMETRISTAINAGLSAGGKQTQRIARRESTLKAQSIRNRWGIDKSKPSVLAGQLWIGGQAYASYHFPSVDQNPLGVRVQIYRRSAHRFPAAWQVGFKGQGKYVPVKQREGRPRYPIFDPVLELGIGLADIVLPYKQEIVDAIWAGIATKFSNYNAD